MAYLYDPKASKHHVPERLPFFLFFFFSSFFLGGGGGLSLAKWDAILASSLFTALSQI